MHLHKWKFFENIKAHKKAFIILQRKGIKFFIFIFYSNNIYSLHLLQDLALIKGAYVT